MSKGETLDRLLEKADQVHHEMNMIFISRGISTPDVIALPKEERKKWFSFKKESDRLAGEINRIVISN